MKAKVIKTREIVDVYHEPQNGQVTNIYKESVLVNGRMWTEDELDFCMQANEAPERLYLSQNIYSTYLYQVPDPADETAVEYTRTDAFIEKACEWLKSNLYDYAGEDKNRNIVPFDEAVYEDFRNYMRGE